jgi:hypothetical protein
MDCREFKEKHVAYVDDVLSAIETEAMRRHLRACARCARHDTCVRRGLMLARNMPQIEPSADFMERLQARLREIDRFDGTASRSRFSGLLPGSFALLAASIIGVAALAGTMTWRSDPPEPLRLQPVVASLPAEPPEPVASAAVVASLATGIPVWPAVFMAGQVPVQAISVGLRDDGR